MILRAACLKRRPAQPNNVQVTAKLTFLLFEKEPKRPEKVALFWCTDSLRNE